LRSLPDNAGWLPHFNHGFPDLFRDGGAIPPIHARAGGADTRLIGITWIRSRAAGHVLVRADSDIGCIADLVGRSVGVYKSLNTAKVDFRRATEHRQLVEALRINAVTADAVQWTNIPDEEAPRYRPARDPEAYVAQGRAFAAKGDVVRDALAAGTIDAIHAGTAQADRLIRSGQARSIEDLGRYDDWRLDIANTPYLTTVSTSLVKAHPEIVEAWLRAAVRAGRWANAHRDEAATLFERVLTAGDATLIADLIAIADFVPSLSPPSRAAVNEQKRFLADHGYIDQDFDLDGWIDDRFLNRALASS
jgi:ABC-type nitrate/sulfonate/bicarbonate transport system substrate-binding protein